MPNKALLDNGALLDRIATQLANRFTGVFSAETVDRYVYESYTAVHRTARIKTYLPTLTEHFAGERRLTALAQARGAIAKPVPEVLFVCVQNAGRSQMAAALISRAADVVITMGCGDACPIYPGKRYLDWDLPDPAHQLLEVVREIRNQINARVHTLLADLLTPA